MLGVNASGNLRVVITDLTQWAFITDPVPLTPGQWYYVEGTHNGVDKVNLYKNGVVVASTSTSNPAKFDSIAPMSVGGRGTGIEYFDGQIAEVRLSSVARGPWETAAPVLAISDPVAGFDVETGKSLAVYNFNNPSEGAVVYDDTGNHNGAVVGSVPLTPGPMSDNTRQLPGVAANYISIPNHTDFDLTAPKTIEIWFIPRIVDVNHRFLVMKYSAPMDSPNIHYDYSNPANLNMNIRDSGSNLIRIITTSTPIVSGRLVYAVMTWDPILKELRGFINGEFFASDSNPLLVPANTVNTSPLILGGDPNDLNPLHSDVCAVRISNYVKTAKEIYDHYHGSNIVEVA